MNKLNNLAVLLACICIAALCVSVAYYPQSIFDGPNVVLKYTTSDLQVFKTSMITAIISGVIAVLIKAYNE